MIASGHVTLGWMVTRYFTRDRIEEACDVLSYQRDGVFKAAITP